jgi:hypothetical protein
MSGARKRIIIVIITVPANPPAIDLVRLGFMNFSLSSQGKSNNVPASRRQRGPLSAPFVNGFDLPPESRISKK